MKSKVIGHNLEEDHPKCFTTENRPMNGKSKLESLALVWYR